MKNREKCHDDWATPQPFYDRLNERFHFDFDPCPLNHDMSWDGLQVEWFKSNFINPPYNQASKEAFVLKALEESRKGKLCVLLLPVSTSTKLFHDIILPNATKIEFVRGRIPFMGQNAKGQWVNYSTTQRMKEEVIFYDGKAIPKYVRNAGQFDSLIVIFDGR
jgi:hypothetical protein